VRLDQVPVDDVAAGVAEERVDVPVPGFGRGAVEVEVFPVAHPRHQVEPKQVCEGVDRQGLALSIGVYLGGGHLGLLLKQALDEIHRLPHAYWYEFREQSNIGVRDIIISDSTGSSIANAGLGQQVVNERVDLGAVGGHHRPVTPGFDQVELGEGVDDIGDGPVELLHGDMPPCGRGQLVGGDPGDVSGGLGRAHVRAVAERCDDVPEQWIG
jgi:hypothetical protein